MDNEIRIRRISIEALLEILDDLYQHGVEYVDFVAEVGEDQDKLDLYFNRTHMHPDHVENYDNIEIVNEDEEDENPIQVKKLTDDDLNQII